MAHFQAGCKPAGELRVGMEHEKIAVLSDGKAPGYELIARLLEEEARQRGWRRVEEHERLIALEGGRRGTVTLEPGGQVEHSGAPWHSAVAAVHDNDQHLDELIPVAAELGVSFLSVGFRPFGTLDDVPWMPKGRYRVMREYLPRRGRLAHEMMKRTATVQANFDYLDEADALEKLRVGLGLSSLVTAMFAASPLVDGKPSGFQSYAPRCWLETDPDRCGLLPFVFDERAGFRDYAEWALDVPLFFLYREGEYRAVDDRLQLSRAARPGGATQADWEPHLSTLFPEVRLKRYVEVRQADAGSRELARALPTLWRGIFYHQESRHAAWALVRDWSFDERLRECIAARPGRGCARGPRRRAAAAVPRARGHRQGRVDSPGLDGGRGMLAPLEEVVATGRTQADRILELHQQTGGDPARLIAQAHFARLTGCDSPEGASSPAGAAVRGVGRGVPISSTGARRDSSSRSPARASAFDGTGGLAGRRRSRSSSAVASTMRGRRRLRMRSNLLVGDTPLARNLIELRHRALARGAENANLAAGMRSTASLTRRRLPGKTCLPGGRAARPPPRPP